MRDAIATKPREAPEMLTAAVLTLPLPPNMANGRMHWRAKDRNRREYFETCDEWQNSGVIPAPPTLPVRRVEIDAVITMPNAMDDDNALARLKWAVDWLVTRGYLAGDSRKHIRWRGLPVQRIRRSEMPSVEFHIQPLTPLAAGEVGG